MELALILATACYLHPTALVYINTTKVHPVWFPYTIAPTLHAARISIIYQSNARRSPSALSWGTYITGYLIMCWGGILLSHFLLGVPPPMLYSFDPAINYITVHLFVTLFFHYFPDLLYPPILDTFLFPMDVLIRTNAFASTLSLLYTPNVHSEYVSSPLTHIVVGVIASAGGDFLASTLGTWNADWALSTPPVLRMGWCLDCFNIQHLYNRRFRILRILLILFIYFMVLSQNMLLTSYDISPDSAYDISPDSVLPPLNTPSAKSIAAAVLSIFFVARVIHMRLPKPRVSPPEVVGVDNAATNAGKKPKKKTQ